MEPVVTGVTLDPIEVDIVLCHKAPFFATLHTNFTLFDFILL